MFTKLMILPIPSVRMTIYRELMELGRILSDGKRNDKEFKMAEDCLKRVERVRIEIDFTKKLRVRGAATFQIRTHRV